MALIQKVFVLLSGGIDSTTTLAMARNEYPDAEIEAITVDYGQRHIREAECASTQAALYNASHYILDMKGILTGMLVDKGDQNEAIPNVDYADLAPGISPTYVSFRNGFMLSLLAARAQTWVMESESFANKGVVFGEHHDFEATIFIGVHADDGVNWAYPDCSPEFIGGMANAIYIGTYNKVRLRAPLQYMDKAAVVREGLRLGVLYAETWSCYVGASEHCGTCPTCRSRAQAFADNNEYDPTIYTHPDAANVIDGQH